MECKICKKEVIYKCPIILKEKRDICKSCFRAEWCKKMWAKRKEDGKIHHWLIKAARLGDKQTEIARKKMSDSHKKPENILIALENLKKITKEQTQKKNELLKGKYVGERNWRWIKDRSKLKKSEDRRNSAYFFLRKEVLIRDNFECRIKNKDCKGRIEIHHILGWKNYPELRYDINNGIALCQFHHPRKRVDEINLSPYFQKLVAEFN